MGRGALAVAAVYPRVRRRCGGVIPDSGCRLLLHITIRFYLLHHPRPPPPPPLPPPPAPAPRCTESNYEGLGRLYERYADYGLVILAFPCNQVG